MIRCEFPEARHLSVVLVAGLGWILFGGLVDQLRIEREMPDSAVWPVERDFV